MIQDKIQIINIIIKIINRFISTILQKSIKIMSSYNNFIQFHRSLLNKRYQEHQNNLNPYGNLLYNNSWKQFPEHPSLTTIKNTNKITIKPDILQWFNGLEISQKIQSLTISNWPFIEKFLRVLQSKYEETRNYNLPTLRSISFMTDAGIPKSKYFNNLFEVMRISWTNEPLLRIQSNKQVLDGLLNWMQNVSNGNIFEYAHKVINKNDPQQNLLWFNSQTFRPLQEWLCNQFQKNILKNYFNKNISTSYYQQFYQHLQDKGQIKELELMNVKLRDSNSATYISIERQSLKKMEENYRDKINSMLIETTQNSKQQKKKKKNKNKKKPTQNKQTISTSLSANEEPNEEDHPEIYQTPVILQEIHCQSSPEINEQPMVQIHSQTMSSIQLQNNKYEHNIISESQEKQSNKRSHSPPESKSQLTNEQSKSWEEESNQKNLRKRKTKKTKKDRSEQQIIYKQMSQRMCSMMLNRQLNNFIDSLSIQTNSMYDSKVASFERVKFFVRGLYPSTEAILFGSNAVGLSLPTSDIDIMLVNLPCRCRDEANQILAQIAIQINTMGWILSCSTYFNAKVPIVKLQIDPLIPYMQRKRKSDQILMIDPNMAYYLQVKDRLKSRTIKVDLAINFIEDRHMGTQSTELMRNWMTNYPVMHRILLALKYVLAHRNYNENFRGGIGSYCLFVMVAAYIKQSEAKGISFEEEGNLFKGILKFYGQQFQNQLKSINLVSEGSCFQPLSNSHNFYQNYPMVQIYDPINNRIMSGSCSQYNSVKSQFRRIRNQILEEESLIQKQIKFNYTVAQIQKLGQNKKALGRWVHKYQGRSGFKIEAIING